MQVIETRFLSEGSCLILTEAYCVSSCVVALCYYTVFQHEIASYGIVFLPRSGIAGNGDDSRESFSCINIQDLTFLSEFICKFLRKKMF